MSDVRTACLSLHTKGLTGVTTRMATTCQYSPADNGSLFYTRSQPAHEQTRGLFIDGRDNGYGASGITGDWILPALDVRHGAWPGMDKREIELQILTRRQRSIENALRRAREKKAREERERLRREQEALWQTEVEEKYGPLESQIDQAIEAEFGPGFKL